MAYSPTGASHLPSISWVRRRGEGGRGEEGLRLEVVQGSCFEISSRASLDT